MLIITHKRMCTFNINFDVKVWADYAERIELSNQAINFALYYSKELFETKKDGVMRVNPRSYVTFCNAISGIEDWSSTESLAMILNIAKGCFDDEDNTVGSLFTMFIRNKLDKLISPQRLLEGKWSEVKKEIYDCINSHGEYNSAIASILATRFVNYCQMRIEQTKKAADICDRLIEMTTASTQDGNLFSEDLVYHMCKTLYCKNPKYMGKLIFNEEVKKRILN